ncbi:tetratricopeptide repeat protein [Candidatus Sumerlaeota bacterium]|nr:tetratricopeptide repeat protein [Candidatus Sumerlaeota bacterium]
MHSIKCKRCTAALGLSLLIGLWGLASAWGDVVITQRGRRIEGQIVRESTGQLTIVISGGAEVTLRRSEIAEIERAEPWQNSLRQGEENMARGNYQRAVDQFEQALQADPPEEMMETIRARLSEAQTAMTNRVNEERERDLATVNDLISRAREELAAGNLEHTMASLDEAMLLRPLPSQEEQILDIRSDALYAQAWSLHDRLNDIDALAVLEQLRAINPNHREGLDLYRRIIEDQPIDSAETVDEILGILETNPDRTDLHARVGEYYARRNRWEEALPHLLAAADSDLHFAQVRNRLRSAMIHAVNAATASGDYDTAIQRYNDLLARFPDEDPSYIDVLIYYRDDRNLARDDLDGRIALALTCLQNGYDTWAREQMDMVLSQDPNHEGANQMLRTFAEASFNEAMAYFQEGRHTLARVQFRNLIQNYNYPDLIEEAQLRMAEIENRLHEQQIAQREQALNLVAQGDEYYAIAQRNLEAWMVLEHEPRQTFTIRGFSRRDTIVRYLRRAILAYETALDLDPELGPLQGGGVNLKLADASRDLATLENRSFPTRERWLSRN